MSQILAPADRGSALQKVIDELKGDGSRLPSVTALRHFPPQPAHFSEFPEGLRPELVDALRRRGIERLYSHQAEAFERVSEGENIVVVTPTASGKTLCYNLPVLNRVLEEPETRALYLFPTKALSQDQLAEVHGLIQDIGADIRTFTYDGDTPQDARKAIRSRGHLVVTNPDMLHSGILPHHPKWVKLFENLRYIIVDEIHAYRGVFGSHLSNILRRLARICRFYGAEPQFICSSATIANPKELTEALVDREVHLIDRSGAPRGERFFVFYNPPVVNAELGIRRSYVNETRRIAASFLKRGLQTIVFTTSRLNTEILVTYLKNEIEQSVESRDLIRGYRGGYLPKKRREIEAGLREGNRARRGVDQRPRARHRHRRARRRRHLRLPGHHRLDLAAGRPRGPPHRRLGGGLHRELEPAQPVRGQPPRVLLLGLAGAWAHQPRQPVPFSSTT